MPPVTAVMMSQRRRRPSCTYRRAQKTQSTDHTPRKMSSVAMRDWAMPSGSAAANDRAMIAHGGGRPSRRASGYTNPSITIPAMTAGILQPNALSPNTRMPVAMANLPISGCGHETSSPPSHKNGGLACTLPSTMVLASLA